MFSQSDQYGGRSAGVVRSGTSKLPSSETMVNRFYKQTRHLTTPITCTNLRRCAGAILCHGGGGAGGRTGAGVAVTRSCPASNRLTTTFPEVRRCEGVHQEDTQSAEYWLDPNSEEGEDA